ncbi:adenylate/guanylate cyclase domain-containing protein [Reyranella sp.]|uniref:adenylate/guanylate cyclase domain-containing protein n=1 Tax=Reyranella sp. TaxID=1929291 RepID=UPI002730002F|nr:adenylate/guanylate cyclase domain-containing protein [Reyranella sp.]MDP2375702.1 adenylate/guanylate cyclase domain-containing protein [Reyranella sp.]
MTARRLSIPFSATILLLMALVLAPLSSALLWLGWRSVESLEQRSADSRVAELEKAVERFLTDGLRVVVYVGLTLADSPSFAAGEGAAADDERRRQLVALLGRHPTVAGAFVGYADGRLVYAGRPESFSPTERSDFGVVDQDAIVMRVVDGEGPARRETSWLQAPDGTRSAERVRPTNYDPRNRPWYVEAEKAHDAVLTAPYHFAWSKHAGISSGVPLYGGGGVIGFDYTLETLSQLITTYKITPNAIIMVGHGVGAVEVESEGCVGAIPGCLPGDTEVRAALKDVIRGAVVSGHGVDRRILIGGQLYRAIVRRVPEALGQRFVVAAAVPVAELAASSRVLLERAAGTAAVAVGFAILGALLASLLVSRSVGRIAAKTERIRNLDFTDRVPVQSRIREIVRLSDAIERMREGLEIFGRYVSKDLVHQIMRSPESSGVGGTRREVTVMFTDIEGFSRLSETMEPELLTSRLSRYFEVLGTAISANRGMIDKYIGDSIMAFWNAPEPDPDHIANACRAALQAAAAGRALSERWQQRGRPGFRTRFGLHTGPAVVGNVGARERINYTLVGAVANQASRLEGMNKVYGTEVLASGEVASPTADRFVWRHIDRIVAVGTTEMHDIHEPLGEIASAADHAELLAHWQAGRTAYAEGRFEAAIACFGEVAALRPGDGPSRVFIARCAEFLRLGTPEGWNGVWHHDAK